MKTCYYCGDQAVVIEDACEHHTPTRDPILKGFKEAVAYARLPKNKGREVETAWNYLRGYLTDDWRQIPAAHQIAQLPINEGGHIE